MFLWLYDQDNSNMHQVSQPHLFFFYYYLTTVESIMGTNFGGPRCRYMLTSERYESDSKKKKNLKVMN